MIKPLPQYTHTIQKLIASECSTLNKFKNINSVNCETKYNNKISNKWEMKPRNQIKIKNTTADLKSELETASDK